MLNLQRERQRPRAAGAPCPAPLPPGPVLAVPGTCAQDQSASGGGREGSGGSGVPGPPSTQHPGPTGPLASLSLGGQQQPPAGTKRHPHLLSSNTTESGCGLAPGIAPPAPEPGQSCPAGTAARCLRAQRVTVPLALRAKLFQTKVILASRLLRLCLLDAEFRPALPAPTAPQTCGADGKPSPRAHAAGSRPAPPPPLDDSYRC